MTPCTSLLSSESEKPLRPVDCSILETVRTAHGSEETSEPVSSRWQRSRARSASRRATRGEVAAGGDYYLCPLASTQLATGELESYLQPVWSDIQQLTEVEYTYSDGKTKKIAVGYEISAPRSTKIDGVEFTWSERQLVVRSLAAAVAGSKSLQTRLEKAQTALSELGQPRRGKKRLKLFERLARSGRRNTPTLPSSRIVTTGLSSNHQRASIKGL